MKRIEGVPESIPRAVVLRVLRAMGLDPMKMPGDSTIRVSWSAIEVEVYAEDEAGLIMWDEADPKPKRHIVVIPLTDPKESSE